MVLGTLHVPVCLLPTPLACDTHRNAPHEGTVIKELVGRGTSVVVVSAVPQWFFEEVLPPQSGQNIEYLSMKTDVGVFQETAVSINFTKTVAELEKHWADMPSKIQSLSDALLRYTLLPVTCWYSLHCNPVERWIE